MEKLVKENFVEKKSDKYFLTNKGIFWGNNISNEVSNLLIKNIFIKGRYL